MASIVGRIENARFFGRPLAVKRQSNLTCNESVDLPAYTSLWSFCQEKAAGDCPTTDNPCICSTLEAYVHFVSDCFQDPQFSSCEYSMSAWPSVVCTSGPPSSSSLLPVSTIPSISSSIPSSSSTYSSSTDSSSSSSSETSTSSSIKTSMITPSTPPKPSLVPITRLTETSGTVTTTPSSSSSHSSLAKWSGSGNLLQGYCNTPEYTVLGGATAYWAPVIGCIKDKADCCPFDILARSMTGANGSDPPRTTDSVASGRSITAAASTDIGGFPSALSQAQATLNKCPDDYFSISDGCCPSNYLPWSTAIGGQTPCYSTVPTAMTPPPIPKSLVGNDASKPTSAVINAVYAMKYPVKPSSKPALATNTMIGIAAGAGGAALVFGILVGLLIWKHRAHKKDKGVLKSLSGMDSAGQSVAASSARGGVSEWRKNVSASPMGGHGSNPGAHLTPPNAAVQRYPADWRPGQRNVSPPIPSSFVHSSRHVARASPSPPIPEGYSEADSQNVMLHQQNQQHQYSNNVSPMSGFGSDRGYSNGSRSELQGEEYPFARQELSSVPEQHQWARGNGLGYHDGVGELWQAPQAMPRRQTIYHEVPAGSTTPRVA